MLIAYYTRGKPVRDKRRVSRICKPRSNYGPLRRTFRHLSWKFKTAAEAVVVELRGGEAVRTRRGGSIRSKENESLVMTQLRNCGGRHLTPGVIASADAGFCCRQVGEKCRGLRDWDRRRRCRARGGGASEPPCRAAHDGPTISLDDRLKARGPSERGSVGWRFIKVKVDAVNPASQNLVRSRSVVHEARFIVDRTEMETQTCGGRRA